MPQSFFLFTFLSLFSFSCLAEIATDDPATAVPTTNYTCTQNVDGGSVVNKLKVEGTDKEATVSFLMKITSAEGEYLGSLSGKLRYRMDFPENPEMGKDLVVVMGKANPPYGEVVFAFVISKGILNGAEEGKVLMMGADNFNQQDCKKDP